MLKIRQDQMEVFSQAVLRIFEDNMIEHLENFAPHHAKSLGKEGVRKVVQLGIKKAETYGLTNTRPVRFYIELMFMLGSFFDNDCQVPWANQILTDPDITDQSERADLLFDKAMDYVEKVAGPQRQYAIASLSHAREQNFNDLCKVQGDFNPFIIARLKHNFPEKCRYIGDTALKNLIKQGRDQAKEYAVSGNAGAAIFTGFMFMSGQGFAQDPLFPWAGETLNDEAITESMEKLERLYSKGIAYVTQVLKKLEPNGR
jgi:hypothetical protein